MNNEEVFILFHSIDSKLVKEAAHSVHKRTLPLWVKLSAVAAVIAISITCLSYYPFTRTFNTDHYTIICKNGNYSISGLEESAPEQTSSPDGINSTKLADIYVYFHSISEMRNDILSGDLTENELQAIQRMKRDGSGNIMIPNLSCLYEPTYPSSFKKYCVRWSGEKYSIALLTDNETGLYICDEDPFFEYYSSNAYMSICTEERYRMDLDQIINFENATQSTITNKIHDPERKATEYRLVTTTSQDRYKVVIYEICTSGKTMHIKESYSDPDDSVPSTISFCGIEHDVYFTGTIKHVKYWMDRPSIEWLSAFGFKKHTSS